MLLSLTILPPQGSLKGAGGLFIFVYSTNEQHSWTTVEYFKSLQDVHSLNIVSSLKLARNNLEQQLSGNTFTAF